MREHERLLRDFGGVAAARSLATMLRGYVNGARTSRERQYAKGALRSFVRAANSGITPGMLALWWERAQALHARHEQSQQRDHAAVGFEPLQFWTPAMALARIEQIDAKVRMHDAAVRGSKVADEYKAAWREWLAKWNGYAADMRDSWFARGFSGTSAQLDAFERELDAFRDKYKQLGGIVHGPELPAALSRPEGPGVDMPSSTNAATLAGAVLAGVLLVKLLDSRENK